MGFFRRTEKEAKEIALREGIIKILIKIKGTIRYADKMIKQLKKIFEIIEDKDNFNELSKKQQSILNSLYVKKIKEGDISISDFKNAVNNDAKGLDKIISSLLEVYSSIESPYIEALRSGPTMREMNAEMGKSMFNPNLTDPLISLNKEEMSHFIVFNYEDLKRSIDEIITLMDALLSV